MNARTGIIRQIVLALVLCFGVSTRAADADGSASPRPMIDGVWRWDFAMPDGTVTRPRLLLSTHNGLLTGTSSFRQGTETPITNAFLTGEQLRFEVIRQRDGQDIVTTYLGRWRGTNITGKIESNWAGESQTYDWKAERTHQGADGTWRWTTSFGGRRNEARVDLKQDGDKLTGAMPGRGGAGGRGGRSIRNGVIKNGDIYFEIESGGGRRGQGGAGGARGGQTNVTTKYTGKIAGDLIKGTIFSNFGGTDLKSDWEARRSD